MNFDDLDWAIQHFGIHAKNAAHNAESPAHRPAPAGHGFAACTNPDNCRYAEKVLEAAIESGIITKDKIDARIAEAAKRARATILS